MVPGAQVLAEGCGNHHSADRTHDAVSASAAVSAGGIDICMLDARLPSNEKELVLCAGRSAITPPARFESAKRGFPRTTGVSHVLPNPRSADDARKLLEVCIHTKLLTRVLIVDDSPTMRAIVRKTLSASRFAFAIEEADQGIDPLDRIRPGNFSLVFLDYSMPGLNDFETLHKIKSITPNVRVVMMTSTIDNAMADRAHAAGARFPKKVILPRRRRCCD